MRFAIVNAEGIVVNVIEAPENWTVDEGMTLVPSPQTYRQLIEVDGVEQPEVLPLVASPGHRWNGQEFTRS